jgi:hypothetical protein
VDLNAGLDRCGESRLNRDSILGPFSPYRVVIPTELSRPFFFIIVFRYFLKRKDLALAAEVEW